MRRRYDKPIAAILFAALASGIGASAGAEEDVNKNWWGVAIRGYDPVAYFTMGEPVEGSSDFEHEWQGATWRFVNASHRDRFAADPEAFAPRYGGYCAGGMALGRKASIDPQAWVIVDGKLYLNYDKKSRDNFAKDPGPKIKEADANWESLGQR